MHYLSLCFPQFEIAKPQIVHAMPANPIGVIFSLSMKNAKIVVTTGMRYSATVMRTVPKMRHAFAHAEKQNVDAPSPRKSKLVQLSSLEKRAAFAATSSDTAKESVAFTAGTKAPIATNGSIKIIAHKNKRLVAAIDE